VLQPGEEGSLEVSFDARRFIGRKTSRLWLLTDNGKKTATVFYVTADSQEGP
jgi:hypothetical protein